MAHVYPLRLNIKEFSVPCLGHALVESGDGMECRHRMYSFVAKIWIFIEYLYDIYRIFLGYELAIHGIQWDKITNSMIFGFVSIWVWQF